MALSKDIASITKVLASDDTGYKMKLINDEAHAKGYPLYLIIDEYDNFTNVILSEGGKEVFRNLTHASGFYREYFKLFKVMFSRVFLIGVSPVTLDDLSSGYNIDWNISQDPDFNYMLGFSESDVREMFLYYKGVGKLRPDADIMVDKNIRTDYKKLKMLADIDKGNQRENRMSVIEEIAATGSIIMNLKTSFPAEYVTDDNNFRSLLYYYGLLTMKRSLGRRIEMEIPNLCVKEQYWGFMRDYFNRSFKIDSIPMELEMTRMALESEWEPFITRIAEAYRENSSLRDSILGEHNLQGFFKTYLALNCLYLVEPKIELNYGFGDFLLLPDKARYPEIAHSYILELKYLKPTATDAEVETKSLEADTQLQRYSNDKIVKKLCANTQLHLLKTVFRGAEMIICTELG